MSKELKKMSALVAAGLAVSSFGMSSVHADSFDSVEEVETQSVTEESAITLEQANQNLEQVQQEVAEAQTVYENLEQQVSNTQEELAVAQTLTEDLTEQVSETQEAITATQVELEEAEQALEVAQANYEQKLAENPSLASELREAEESYKEAETKEKSLTEQVSNAQIETNKAAQALASAEKAVSETKTAIETTTSALSSVQNDLSSSKKTLETAATNLTSTEAMIADRLKELAEAVENAGSDQVVSTRTLLVTSVDGTERIEKTKDSTHEQVLYAGNKTVEIEISPEQLVEYKETGSFTYKANNEAVAQYLVSMLKELRDLNGIDIPVPELSQAAMEYAQKRADEMNATKVLSHDTKYDTTHRAQENAGYIPSSGLSYMSGAILSDEQAAYNILLAYFADYENRYAGNYGHRVTLLTASGDSLGSAFSGRYHVMDFMDYTGQTDTYEFSRQYWSVLTEITYDNDNTMYYKGQRLTFLPKTTYNYVTKVVEVLPNEEKQAAEKALADYRDQSAKILANAKTALEQAEDKFNNLSSQLEELMASLEQLEKNLPVQEKLVSSLQEDLTDKETKEKSLLNELEEAKKAATNKRDVLLTILGKSEDLIASRQALVEAENKVETLSELLGELKTKLIELPSLKLASEADVVRLSELLTELETDRDEAKVIYEELLIQLEEAQSLVDGLTAKEIISKVIETGKNTESNSSVSPQDDSVEDPILASTKGASGQLASQATLVTALTASNHSTSQQGGSLALKEATTNQTTSLPNTGNKRSPMLMIIGFWMIFSALRKLRKENN